MHIFLTVTSYVRRYPLCIRMKAIQIAPLLRRGVRGVGPILLLLTLVAMASYLQIPGTLAYGSNNRRSQSQEPIDGRATIHYFQQLLSKLERCQVEPPHITGPHSPEALIAALKKKKRQLLTSISNPIQSCLGRTNKATHICNVTKYKNAILPYLNLLQAGLASPQNVADSCRTAAKLSRIMGFVNVSFGSTCLAAHSFCERSCAAAQKAVLERQQAMQSLGGECAQTTNELINFLASAQSPKAVCESYTALSSGSLLQTLTSVGQLLQSKQCENIATNNQAHACRGPEALDCTKCPQECCQQPQNAQHPACLGKNGSPRRQPRRNTIGGQDPTPGRNPSSTAPNSIDQSLQANPYSSSDFEDYGSQFTPGTAGSGSNSRVSQIPGGGGGGLGGGGGGGGGLPPAGGEGGGGSAKGPYNTDILGGVAASSGGGSFGGGGRSPAAEDSSENSGFRFSKNLEDGAKLPSFDMKSFLPGGEKAAERTIAGLTGQKPVTAANGLSNFEKVSRKINENRMQMAR